MSEDLTFIGKHIFEFFMVLFLVALGIHYRNLNVLDDLTKVYAEISATNGGFTSSLYNDLVDALQNKRNSKWISLNICINTLKKLIPKRFYFVGIETI